MTINRRIAWFLVFYGLVGFVFVLSAMARGFGRLDVYVFLAAAAAGGCVGVGSGAMLLILFPRIRRAIAGRSDDEPCPACGHRPP
jgi:hypothetical protein